MNKFVKFTISEGLGLYLTEKQDFMSKVVRKIEMSRTIRVRITDLSPTMVRWSGPVRFLGTTLSKKGRY
uniref:Uncharacterized protein n=1 Tax=Amphimedon queenslandica TaxID=400682 RepID=A0A1X7U877_AMPQE